MNGDPATSPGNSGPERAGAPAVETKAGNPATLPPYVIDTSVAVKWYIPETLSVEAKHYMGKGLDRHAPDDLPAEAASVVLKRVRSRDAKLKLSFDEARMVLAAMKTVPIQLHESRMMIDPSFALAEQVGSSLYDGLFLALTLRLGGQHVTADEALFKKIRASQYAASVRWVADAP
jgi:predicted nucleic acid-binding protein